MIRLAASQGMFMRPCAIETSMFAEDTDGLRNEAAPPHPPAVYLQAAVASP